MPKYEELVNKYQKRRKETLVDTLTAGLSYADNVAVDLGLMEESGMLESLTAAAPFAVIAVTEQMRVILGKKTGKAGLLPEVGGAYVQGESEIASVNMVYGASAMGTRALLSQYRSKSLLNLRVQERTGRLRAIRDMRQRRAWDAQRPALPAGAEYLEE